MIGEFTSGHLKSSLISLMLRPCQLQGACFMSPCLSFIMTRYASPWIDSSPVGAFLLP